MTVLDCALVICTRDRPSQLADLLARIQHIPFRELLIIDSAPKVPAKDLAKQFEARYFLEERPGLSRARNRGIREATAAIVLFMEDDAIPGPGWPDEMLSEFTDPDVAMVMARVLPAHQGGEAIALLEDLAGYGRQGTDRKVFDRNTEDWYAAANFGGIGIGGTTAIRRSIMNQWAGYDERIGVGTKLPGHEDHRASFQVISLGWRVVYTPSANIFHPSEPRSASELRSRSLQAISAASGALLLSLCEDPTHHRELWQSVVRKIMSGTRETEARKAEIPLRRIVLARLQGLWSYLVIVVSQGKWRAVACKPD